MSKWGYVLEIMCVIKYATEIYSTQTEGWEVLGLKVE